MEFRVLGPLGVRADERALDLGPPSVSDRAAVITDIHANLPALQARWRASTSWASRRSTAAGSGRLRPASQRGVRANRRARDPDDLRQLRLVRSETDLPVVFARRRCLFDHLQRLQDELAGLGQQVGIQVDDASVTELDQPSSLRPL
jgi:hypothetical protein